VRIFFIPTLSFISFVVYPLLIQECDLRRDSVKRIGFSWEFSRVDAAWSCGSPLWPWREDDD